MKILSDGVCLLELKGLLTYLLTYLHYCFYMHWLTAGEHCIVSQIKYTVWSTFQRACSPLTFLFARFIFVLVCFLYSFGCMYIVLPFGVYINLDSQTHW